MDDQVDDEGMRRRAAANVRLVERLYAAGPRAYWVHAWAVEGGRIARLREYFNTSVTVRDVGGGGGCHHQHDGRRRAAVCWQSQRGCDDDKDRSSLPGLVLAI
uniref:Wound-induced protein 1 n=1 Tax=Leersia perrieri TaxID=77586 RepID=A0A0D9WFA6_9ORYZ